MKRLMSLFLVIAMIFSMLPVSAIAAQTDPEETAAVEETTVPTESEEASEPSEPEDPSEPSEPEDSSEPSESEDPSEPSEPEDSSESSESEAPSEPSEPETPQEGTVTVPAPVNEDPEPDPAADTGMTQAEFQAALDAAEANGEGYDLTQEVVLTDDLSSEFSSPLHICEGGKLTVSAGKTMYIRGTMDVENGGCLEVSGTVQCHKITLEDGAELIAADTAALEVFKLFANLDADGALTSTVEGVDSKLLTVNFSITAPEAFAMLPQLLAAYKGIDMTVEASMALPADLTIPYGSTLYVQDGMTLTIPQDITLTNGGSIIVWPDAVLSVEKGGTIDNKRWMNFSENSSLLVAAGGSLSSGVGVENLDPVGIVGDSTVTYKNYGKEEIFGTMELVNQVQPESNTMTQAEFLDALEASGGDYTLTQEVVLTDDLSSDFSGSLSIAEGGSLTIPAGKTLTFADESRIFVRTTGSLTVDGSITTQYVYAINGGSVTLGDGGVANCYFRTDLDEAGDKTGSFQGVEDKRIDVEISAETAEQLLNLPALCGQYLQVRVYMSKSLTPGSDVTIPENSLLMIANRSTLTISGGNTLTNNGRIEIGGESRLLVKAGGSLTNTGTITGSQSAVYENNGTETNEGGTISLPNQGQLGSPEQPDDGSTMTQEMLGDLLAAAMEAGERRFTLTSSVTLTEDFVSEFTGWLDVSEGGSLTVPEGINLTMSGRITVCEGGTVTINGNASLRDIDVDGGTLTVGEYAAREFNVNLMQHADGSKPGTISGVPNSEIYLSTRINTTEQIANLPELAAAYKWVTMTVETSLTLDGSVTVPDKVSFWIDLDQTLTIPAGVILTNNGSLSVWDNGTLKVEAGGQLINNGQLELEDAATLLVEKNGKLVNEGSLSGYGAAVYENYGEYAGGGTSTLENQAGPLVIMTQAELEQVLQDSENGYYELDAVVELERDMVLKSFTSLWMNKGSELIIPDGVTLTIEENATLSMMGGDLTINGTLNAQHQWSVSVGSGTLYAGENAVLDVSPDALVQTSAASAVLSGSIDRSDMALGCYANSAAEVASMLKAAAGDFEYGYLLLIPNVNVVMEESLTIPENTELQLQGVWNSEYDAWELRILAIPEGLTLTNYGLIALNDYGCLELRETGTLANYGTITKTQSGIFKNEGGTLLGDTSSLIDPPMTQEEFQQAFEAVRDQDGMAFYDLTSAVTLTSDFRLPESTQIMIQGGGSITVESGATLTLADSACIDVFNGTILVRGGLNIQKKYSYILVQNGTLTIENPDQAVIQPGGIQRNKTGGDSITGVPDSLLGLRIPIFGLSDLEAAIEAAKTYGMVYATQQANLTLEQPLEIPANMELSIQGNYSDDEPYIFSIANGAVLTNYGVIDMAYLGMLIIEDSGLLYNHNKIYNYIGDIIGAENIQGNPPETSFAPSGVEAVTDAELRAALKAGLTEDIVFLGDITLKKSLTVDAPMSALKNYGRIVVPSGKTLTIKSQVLQDGIIEVKKGGKLVITADGWVQNFGVITAARGSTVTLASTNSLWNYPEYGGEVSGISAKKMHAVVAVQSFEQFRDSLALCKKYAMLELLLDNNLTLKESVTIPANAAVQVIDDLTVTVPEGVVIANRGEIYVTDGAVLQVDAGAEWINYGDMAIYGRYNNEGTHSGPAAELKENGTQSVANQGYRIEIAGPEQVLGGKAITLTANFLPDNITDTSAKWTIEGSAATLQVSKGKAIITAADVSEPATVTVTAASRDGEAKADSVAINIIPRTKALFLYSERNLGGETSLDRLDNISFYPPLEDINASYTTIIRARVEPYGASTELKWEVSDPEVAAILKQEPLEDGTVRMELKYNGKDGPVTITAAATDGTKVSASAYIGFYKQDTVTIAGESEDLILTAGDEVDLTLMNKYTGTAYSPKSTQWSLQTIIDDKPDAFYGASRISATGTLSTKDVKAVEDFYAVGIAKSKDMMIGQAKYHITVYPRVTQLRLFQTRNDVRMDVTGQTIPLDISGGVNPLGLELDVTPHDALQGDNIRWTSSNEAIATVEDGVVTPVEGKTGTVTITAQALDGSKQKASVKVQIGIMATSVEISDKNGNTGALMLRAGSSLYLKADVWADQEAGLRPTNENVIWRTSGPISITSSGKLTGKTVYSPSAGFVEAVSADGAQALDMIKVWVLPKAAETLILVKEFDGGEEYATKRTFYAEPGETISLSAYLIDRDEFDIDDVFSGRTPKSVSWKSSRSTVASVSAKKGEDVVVTVKKAGTATITATAKNSAGKTITATVTIKAGTLAEEVEITSKVTSVGAGKSITLKASAWARSSTGKRIQPTTKGVTWEMWEGDKDLATITSSGKLTASKNVTSRTVVTVDAVSKDGNVYVGVPVTIYPLATGVDIFGNGTHLTGTQAWPLNLAGLETMLTARVYPFFEENSERNALQAVTWESSNTKIAKIDQNGKLTFTGRIGTVTITAAATDGSGRETSFKVKTFNLMTLLRIKDGGIAGGKSLKLGTLTEAMDENATDKTLTYEITGGDGAAFASISGSTLKTKPVTERKVVHLAAYDSYGFSRTNPESRHEFSVVIAPVSKSVKIFGNGEAVSKTLSYPINIDQPLQLTAQVASFAEGDDASAWQDVTWKSSNTKILTISKDGVVSFKGKTGTVTVTATTADGCGKYATFKLKAVKCVTTLEINDGVIAGGKTLKLGSLTEKINSATDKTLYYSIIGGDGAAYAKISGTSLKTSAVDSPKLVELEATDAFGYTKASFEVTICPATTRISFKAVEAWGEKQEYAVTKTVLLPQGETLSIEGVAWPNNPDDPTDGAFGSFSWKNSNKKYARMGVDETGTGVILTGLKKGTTVTITATAKDGTGRYATMKVKIVAPLPKAPEAK